MASNSGTRVSSGTKKETASEESSNEMLESERESETSAVCVGGWEDAMVDDKKSKAYAFTKNAGSQFNLLPDVEPMDYFSSFFNDKLLTNTVTRDKQVCKTQNSASALPEV
jgi:hypothetical protein